MKSAGARGGAHGQRRVIYGALLGNLLVAATKFCAAAFTGSSAMLSEGVHSLVDTGNELLLLYGMRRAARPADQRHPLGHGRELYFWSFMVSLLIFAIGSTVSVYEGVERILHPASISTPAVNYAVLALGMLFEGSSWWVALGEFRRAKGDDGYLDAMRDSKDPPTFMVLFEDSAALIGLAIAAAGTAAAQISRMAVFDGLASVAIGVLLFTVAVLLTRETKGLLIGEGAREEVVASICSIARGLPGVESANGLYTVHLGPRQVVAGLSVHFADHLTAAQVETIVARIEAGVRKVHPEIVSITVKPESVAAYQASQARLGDSSDGE